MRLLSNMAQKLSPGIVTFGVPHQQTLTCYTQRQTFGDTGVTIFQLQLISAWLLDTQLGSARDKERLSHKQQKLCDRTDVLSKPSCVAHLFPSNSCCSPWHLTLPPAGVIQWQSANGKESTVALKQNLDLLLAGMLLISFSSSTLMNPFSKETQQQQVSIS